MGLVLESSLLLVLSESLGFVAFVAHSVRAYGIWCVLGTQGCCLELFIFLFKELLCMIGCFNLEEAVSEQTPDRLRNINFSLNRYTY